MRANVPGYTSHLQTFSSTEARAIRTALLAMIESVRSGHSAI